MKIYKAQNYYEMSRVAARIISAQIVMKPDCVLGLATGSTPIGIYDQLVEWYQNGDLDFENVTTFNLDEYRGISREDEHSYYYFMRHHLFDRVNIDINHTHMPDGMEMDVQKVCSEYNELIRQTNGIDLQLLGIGHNGHIGFNEPDSHFELETHCVRLNQRTVEANQRFFSSIDEVPREAYTMGIKNVMQAKKILIVASGEDKAAIVKKAFAGPVCPEVPASILQMHNDVILVADEAALSLLIEERAIMEM